MLKAVSLLLLLVLIPSSCMGEVCVSNSSFIDTNCSNNSKLDIVSELRNYGNATFIKDYSGMPVGTSGSLSANYSVGSGTATFTATRSSTAPATYIDQSGLVTTTTSSNVPRVTAGFYNSSGYSYRPGIILEGASTNLVPKSSDVNDATWTVSNVTPDDADAGSSAPDGSSTSPSLTATAGNGTFLLTTGVTASTYSVWLKRKTGTGTINITANGGTTWTAATITTSWTRHQVTAASASQTCGIQIVTSGDAVYVWGNQFENLPFASTLIPTTNGALTRGAESLTYAISGNRTAASETVFIKQTNYFSIEDITADVSTLTTDTKVRRVSYNASNNQFRFSPNETDSSLSRSSDGITTQKYSSTVWAAVAKHSSPYAETYENGVSGGSDTDDFTDPVWGTNFTVGSALYYGQLSSLCIYSDAKSATTVASISSLVA